MNNILDLLLLFFSSLLAATLFPAQSELVLLAIDQLGEHSKLLLLTIATTGNVLGAVINWLIGYYLIGYKNKKWFPIKKKQLDKASKLYKKWGVWSLLLAWLPIIGDPLTLVAGIFKTRICLFLSLVTLGKASRYALLLYYNSLSF